MEGNRFETVKLATQFWNSDSETTTIIVVLSIIGFIIFFTAGFLFQKYRKERSVFEYFKRYALDRELTPEEIKLLWAYAQKMGRDPMVVLEFKAPFEKVVDLYLQENPNADERIIKDMRKKLGFEILSPYIPLVSTKDIELFQNATLIHQNKSYNATLYDKDERYMYWLLSDAIPSDLKSGDLIKIIFIRKDDAIYTVIVPIEKILNENGKIVIQTPHTFEMSRTQRREYPRVRTELPVKVFYHDEKEDKQYTLHGEMVDISAGGARICFNGKPDIIKRFKYADIIQIEFTLLDIKIKSYLKLLDKIEYANNLCIRGTFEELSAQIEQKIHEYVQKEQKKLAQLKNA
ncbi:flagellar brake protein [Nitratiruptor sp. SB155-2]|uniref:flagellar brake protein n=1 Tax=Nitratiruptor sp. (strain SB155-2) TaxID=387092 RepID=UPI0001586DEE|nr:PilZ domain-containing protein [Nitratiruptor sp. SB155-2]BAF69753.1 conserved hypothetical protein [Nitratiruptor sp. SB155-2]